MSRQRSWHKPHWAAWVAIALAVATLIFMSVWQVQRMVWKEAIIEELRLAAANPPAEVLPSALDLQHKGFMHYRLYGTFGKQSLHLAARYYRGTLGYHLLSPFTLEDGRILLVNRGWIPAEMKDDAPAASDEEQTITVMLRTDKDYNYFTPASDPRQNVWFYRDLHAMGRALDAELLPVSADLLGTPIKGELPVPFDGDFKLRNDHLQYAITWAMLAIVALWVFITYHWRKKEAV